MIRSLRQRHRRSFTVLGVALPVVFALGLAARKPVPVTTLPATLAGSATAFTVISERADLFTNVPMRVKFLRATTDAEAGAVSFSAPEHFAKPDLIVYWIAGNAATFDTVPDNARLLGSLSARELKLPAVAMTTEGVLLLFSLADQEMVDVSKPFNLQKN